MGFGVQGLGPRRVSDLGFGKGRVTRYTFPKTLPTDGIWELDWARGAFVRDCGVTRLGA